ncbi:major facilitator superfamily domain-containing protein [Xylariomycetidae sp. FL0641]|nr:major facilitator superfamily domain-containing protein [Xylariomycetidae sp. FL0641]
MSDEKPNPSSMAKEPALANAREASESGEAGQTSREERTVVRKLDLHLMSLFFVLYMLAFLDRGNIGNAKIAGMEEDLQLTSSKYNWLINIFYITYVLFEFGVLLWKIFPPHLVATGVVFGWGLISTVQAVTQNWGGMMALRALLGVSEACYAPGITYLLSFFYLRHELGFRLGIFVSAAPLASTFSGALAYGITSGHATIANWRLLFLVEGLPTIAMAAIAFFFIPDSPEHARCLTEDEKKIVRSRVVRQVGTSAKERIGGFKPRDVIPVLLDLKAWMCALMYFCGNVSYASLPVFLPTIIEDMGYTSINAQGLSAPPSFVAFLFALITTWVADKTQQRCIVLTLTATVGGIGYIILATVETVGVRYFATFLASAGVFSTMPNILALNMNNQGNDARRGISIVLTNIIGQCGPFVGTNVFPAAQGPRYVTGMSICAAFMFFSAILAMSQRLLLSWENTKLDRKYGETAEGTGNNNPGGTAVENYGPNFRYVY